MQNSLLIGSSSQLAMYFPDNFQLVGARDFINDKKDIVSNSLCTVLAFGENRTYLDKELGFEAFKHVNYQLTMQAIEKCLTFSDKVIVFATSELWGKHSSGVTIDTAFDFNKSNYVLSKLMLVDAVKTHFASDDVRIIYPFNFNTRYRKGQFLMGKVINSILTKSPIQVADTHFRRDLTTPLDIVNLCNINEIWKEAICGSGQLLNINSVITELYNIAGLNKEAYVSEVFTSSSERRHCEYFDLHAKLKTCIGGPRLNALEWMKADLLNALQGSHVN